MYPDKNKVKTIFSMTAVLAHFRYGFKKYFFLIGLSIAMKPIQKQSMVTIDAYMNVGYTFWSTNGAANPIAIKINPVSFNFISNPN